MEAGNPAAAVGMGLVVRQAADIPGTRNAGPAAWVHT
jgi:hypothetical protein